MIPEKREIAVEFYAREAGTYPFTYSHFCGEGHLGIKGKVVVE